MFVSCSGLKVVESVIAKERPDGVVVSMGGQTALNCGVALHHQGVWNVMGRNGMGYNIIWNMAYYLLL